MQLNLKPLKNKSFYEGSSSPCDVFDSLGCLLLAKGQTITPFLMEMLRKRKLYTLEYHLDNPINKAVQFSAKLYKKTINLIEQAYLNVNLFDKHQLDQTLETVDELVDSIKENPNVYFDFNRFRTYDNYTFVHSVNVSMLATMIGITMGYHDDELRFLTLGALLHDFGKVNVPLQVLNKPGKLSPEEFEIIKRHPVFAQTILTKFNTIPMDVIESIRQHHERWNGKGYPDGLKTHQIRHKAQIIAVADVFDALLTDRPYRPGLPPYHAVELVLSGSGTDFSPEVVEAFRRSLHLYPENSIVKLNSGEIGIVVSNNINHPTRPLVRILYDKDGNYLNEEITIDLLKDLTHFISEVKFNNAS